MTGEQMERAIEFVLVQQGQFLTDMAQMREVQATFQTQLNTLGETVGTVVAVVGSLGERQREADERLAEIKASADRQREETDRKIAAVADRLDRLSDRVDVVITVAERYFSRGNGNPPPS